jgi:FAD:protein FMN transferase
MHQEFQGKRLRPMMGTWVAIEARVPVSSDPAQALEAALEAAIRAVERVDLLMHPTRAGSDLERISGAKPGAATRVDPWTFAVLQQSARLNLQTHGLFDPCLARASGRMPDIVLSEPDVVVCHAPVAVDLGGIAKGFAVDKAVEILRAHGCTAGLVNAGGDLRVFGGSLQTIHIRNPANEAIQVELVDAALAVSAARNSTSPTGHIGYYLGTIGATVEGRQVAIAAPQAMVADALCKCAIVCAPAMLSGLLQRYAARLLHHW